MTTTKKRQRKKTNWTFFFLINKAESKKRRIIFSSDILFNYSLFRFIYSPFYRRSPIVAVAGLVVVDRTKMKMILMTHERFASLKIKRNKIKNEWKNKQQTLIALPSCRPTRRVWASLFGSCPRAAWCSRPCRCHDRASRASRES